MANSTTATAVRRTSDEEYSDLWWTGALQGFVALLFGIVALFWPGLTLVTLVYLFSAYIVLAGLIGIVEGVMSIGRRSNWWLTLFVGLASVGVGVYLVRHPTVTFKTFIIIIGIALIIKGLVEVLAGVFNKARDTSRTLSVVVGLLSVLAGVVILWQPVASGVAFVWILGLYAMVAGALLLAVSFAMHNSVESVYHEK